MSNKCFKVTQTLKRGIRVQALTDKIAEFRNNDSGYFAILSTQFKDANEALQHTNLETE